MNCLCPNHNSQVFIIRIYTQKSSEGKRKYHPVRGTVFHELLNFNRLHDYMTDLARQLKTFRLLNVGHDEIYTTDPAVVEYMLKTNFPNYGKGWYFYNMMTDLLGDGIFTVDGEKWRHQRKQSSYEFSTKILRDFSSFVFKDNVTKIILGVELDSMCGTNEEGNRFSDCFDEASAIILYRYVSVFWKIKKFLNIGSEAKLKKCVKVVDEYVYKMTKKGDVLSRFLELKETDPKYLKDIILSFIIAGKDTTASTLSWFIYMLCKFPHVQEKIAQEVREATKIKGDSTSEEIANGLTEEAIDKLQYLHASLTETLRIYPAVPMDGKLCFSDDTLPDGYSVKKGDLLVYHPYAMGRMKFLWGDDAEEFRPERWLDENGMFKPESPFKFTAFQAGPRICLGKEFAYRQMKIFSAVLLGSFKFKLSDETKQVNYRSMITLHVDGGLHIRAIRR
ncbi:Cytochrome P450 [Dillenia turbinata]|uniref:Cytochrome P450 n=1 Tax=Dillenia turbinata TaxID=194707 RepID=A0AAN8VLR6_9MAGN